MLPRRALTVIHVLRLALALGMTPGLASALPPSPTWADCSIDKYQRYAEAQTRWQERLASLVAGAAPAHAELSTQLKNQQLQLIERSRLEFEHLVRHEPAKLQKRMNPAEPNTWLMAFDAQDRQRLSARNARYAELLSLAEAHRRQPPHPHGDALRTLMREDIMRRQDYAQLLQEQLQAVKRVGDLPCPVAPRAAAG